MTTFGVDVHVNLLKNRVRVSLGAWDAISLLNSLIEANEVDINSDKIAVRDEHA